MRPTSQGLNHYPTLAVMAVAVASVGEVGTLATLGQNGVPPHSTDEITGRVEGAAHGVRAVAATVVVLGLKRAPLNSSTRQLLQVGPVVVPRAAGPGTPLRETSVGNQDVLSNSAAPFATHSYPVSSADSTKLTLQATILDSALLIRIKLTLMQPTYIEFLIETTQILQVYGRNHGIPIPI